MDKNKINFRKFKLQELLNDTAYSKRKKAKQDLICLLGVSESTFNRIMYANIGDMQDISVTNMVKVAKYFGITVEELVNNEELVMVGSTILVR